jgi:hypothetical protein
MSEKNNQKLNVLKRILGKKMVVIKDFYKNLYYYGTIQSIIDSSNVKVKNPQGDIEDVSIFNLRSPSNEYE